MKYFKFSVLVVLVSFFMMSCSNNQETKIDSSVDKGLRVTKQLSLDDEIAKTKKDLIQLLKKENKSLLDKDLIVGRIEDNSFITKSENINQVLLTYLKLIGLEAGQSVDFSKLEFVDAKDNNGYYMVFSKGKCKLSSEDVSVGVGLALSSDAQSRNGDPVSIDGGQSKVVCTGCSVGCNPKRDSKGNGYCTDCDPLAGNNCVKTESI